MIFDIKNQSDVELLKLGIKAKGNIKVGLTSGCFDLFHSLHLTYLKRCRRLCDVLIVGVDSDDMVKSIKGLDRPIITEQQRVTLIGELTCVTAAFIMGDVHDLGRAIEFFDVRYLYKNDSFKSDEIIGRDKTEVVIVPDVKVHDSTTSIVKVLNAKPI